MLKLREEAAFVIRLQRLEIHRFYLNVAKIDPALFIEVEEIDHQEQLAFKSLGVLQLLPLYDLRGRLFPEQNRLRLNRAIDSYKDISLSLAAEIQVIRKNLSACRFIGINDVENVRLIG